MLKTKLFNISSMIFHVSWNSRTRVLFKRLITIFILTYIWLFSVTFIELLKCGDYVWGKKSVPAQFRSADKIIDRKPIYYGPG